MTKLLVVLTPLVLALGCRDRVDRAEHEPYSKTSETAHDDFETTRNTYAQHINDRLDKLDARIHELAARGTEKAREAADELRAERERLRPQLDEMRVHAKAGWDAFEAGVTKGVDDLQRKIEDAFKD